VFALWAAVATAQEPEVVLPTVLYEAPVAYPESRLVDAEAALVRMEVDITDAGLVAEARIVESPGDDFSAAAIEAMQRFRFTPATYGGEPVGVTIVYVLRFEPEVVPRLSLEGLVREAGIRVPVEGVAIEMLGPEGAVAYARTDAEGRFVAYDLASGTWSITATGRGLSAESVALEVTDDRVVQVSLFPKRDKPWEDDGVEEIVVETRAEPVEVSERRLSTKEAMALPGTNGDIVKAVLNLPGIARPPLGIGQLIVRGTEPTDSRFYVDGAPVPQVFHFGGLSTVLNGDVLEDIRFLPGNYSVRYGDALGGLVDLVPNTEVPTRSRGYVSIDVYQAAAFVEQRLSKKTWITVSGRRSYADAVLGPILASFGGGDTFQAPRYYDAQVRVAHRTDDGGLFDSWVVFSDDQFRLLGQDAQGVQFGLATTFLTGSIGYRAPLGGGWRSETRLTAGPDRNAFTFDDDTSFEEKVSLSLRQELSREVPEGGRFGWRLGADIQSAAFRFELGVPGFGEVDKGSGWRTRPAIYGESTLRVGPVDIITGLRAGMSIVPGVHRSTAIDPRLTVVGRVGGTTTLVGSVGRYSQFPLDREVLPTSRGVAELTPPWNLQSSVGLRQQLPFDLSLEVTGFYNELYDLVSGNEDRFEFTAGPPTPLPEDTGAYANDGRGRVFGGELLFKMQGERSAAWLSATVSRSTRRDRPDEVVELFQFDQTLTLNALATYKLAKRWTLGGRVRVGTGNPYYPVTNRVQDLSSRTFLPIFSNDPKRLRTFWALDLRVDKEWVFKRWALTLYLDVQNITDPGNIELIGYSYDFRDEEPIRSTPPLPAFGLKGAW
jgi:TonB family protein